MSTDTEEENAKASAYARLRDLCEQGAFSQLVSEAERFLSLYPGHGRATHLLGFARVCCGQAGPAIEALQEASRLLPEDGEVRDHLGAALNLSGRHEEAAKIFDLALALEPERAETWVNAGKNRLDLKQPEIAADHCRAAIRLRPELFDAHLNLSSALSALRQHAEALVESEAAVALAPESAAAHLRRANALRDLGRTEECIKACDRALVIDPGHAQAWHDMVQALCRAGDLDQAQKAAERAIELLPDDPVVMSTLASVYSLRKRYPEAERLLRSALVQRPDHAMDWLKLGNVREDLGAPRADIVAAYRRAAELDPDLETAQTALIFYLNYAAETTADELLALARHYGQTLARRTSPDQTWGNVPDPERPLRVGLVSADFCDHPVAYFLEGFLIAAQRKGIEWVAYAGVLREDHVTGRFRSLFSEWRNTLLMSDAELASKVRSDRIDILIDLSGHTSDSRLPVMAQKPAPVQATWLGYVGTTGLTSIDYIIGDPWLFPEGQESGTVETPWRLPECYMCFTTPPFDLDCGEPPMLQSGHPTFGSFNNLNKINDDVVALWAEVLHAVPDAKLLLRARQLGRDDVREDLLRRFVARGIDAERLTMGGSLATREDGLREYRKVDIALDPAPYTGATTSAEALWMGVPVLTMRGGRVLSRVGESLNRAVGLADWIARDRAEYVRLAARFAKDPDRLRHLRRNLRHNGSASPLGNSEWFSNQFIAALRSMWRQWCASR